jgi:hypothetical protein
MNELDNYRNPLPDNTYISRSLASFEDPGRKIRIATKLLDQPLTFAYAIERGEVVLRHKDGAATTIRAKFFEDDRGVFNLNIQGYTIATNKPHNASFTFRGDEIGKLVEFLNHIQNMPLKTSGSMVIPDEHLRRMVLSDVQARALIRDNEELIAEVVRSEVTTKDVIAVAYRKKQLQAFERMLSDEAYFESLKVEQGCSAETLWQRFFENNQWVFGYGLSYVAVEGWNNMKLEQYVRGHSIGQVGKEADAVLRTRGIVSSLCFVEIKTHKTRLLQAKSYRSGCWAASDDLAGGIAQVHGTVSAAADGIRERLALDDKQGFPTGEAAYNYLPRSFLVAGSLGQFVGDHGVNREQFRSFELLRRNTTSPEIITFDELHERARFIVDQAAR